jgi:hypothetical protein
LSYSSRDLSKIDWNFSDLGNEGIHGFHWYPGGFVSAIPGSVIPLLSSKDSLIVDPFCGMGTTGVEAIRLGRKFVGFDINPVATLISRAKLLLPDAEKLLAHFSIYGRAGLFAGSILPKRISHPNAEILKTWYHVQTFSELLGILQVIRSIENSDEALVCQAVFSSILKSVSSQSRHYGWICDNVKPKLDEIVYKDAHESFLDSLERYIKGVELVRVDMRHRGFQYDTETLRSRWRIQCSDAIEGLSALADASVDMIMTSPPYFGVVDYVKSQRLSFLWFHNEVLPVDGYSTIDFERLRHKEVGSRSYRGRETSHSDYIDYLRRFMLAAKRVLKDEGVMCLVLGESTARSSTNDDLQTFSLEAGFKLDFAKSRSISTSKRRIAGSVGTEVLRVYTLG